MALIAFEYNREQDSLHNNIFFDAEYDHPIGSNGFLPLAIIPHEYVLAPEWEQLCAWIHETKPTYEYAVERTLATIKNINK